MHHDSIHSNTQIPFLYRLQGTTTAITPDNVPSPINSLQQHSQPSNGENTSPNNILASGTSIRRWNSTGSTILSNISGARRIGGSRSRRVSPATRSIGSSGGAGCVAGGTPAGGSVDGRLSDGGGAGGRTPVVPGAVGAVGGVGGFGGLSGGGGLVGFAGDGGRPDVGGHGVAGAGVGPFACHGDGGDGGGEDEAAHFDGLVFE